MNKRNLISNGLVINDENSSLMLKQQQSASNKEDIATSPRRKNLMEKFTANDFFEG